jgi:hypothetical protein
MVATDSDTAHLHAGVLADDTRAAAGCVKQHTISAVTAKNTWQLPAIIVGNYRVADTQARQVGRDGLEPGWIQLVCKHSACVVLWGSHPAQPCGITPRTDMWDHTPHRHVGSHPAQTCGITPRTAMWASASSGISVTGGRAGAVAPSSDSATTESVLSGLWCGLHPVPPVFFMMADM